MEKIIIFDLDGTVIDTIYDITDAMNDGDKRAKLAMDILIHYIKKIIGSYVAEMNGVDALVFTAGVGENDRYIRQGVCRDMSYLGIEIDEELNWNLPKGSEAELTKEGAFNSLKTLLSGKNNALNKNIAENGSYNHFTF